jgi:hypothetical protein
MRRLREGLPFLSPAMIDVTDMAERPDVELFGPLLQVIGSTISTRRSRKRTHALWPDGRARRRIARGTTSSGPMSAPA